MLEVNVFPCIFSFDYMYKDNSFFFWVLPHFRLKSPAEDRGRGTVSAYQVCSGVMITWDVCRVMLGGGGTEAHRKRRHFASRSELYHNHGLKIYTLRRIVI
jgi:hypothetical protein